MSARFFVAIAVSASIAGSVRAQTYSRRATAMGGVGTDRGKCTIEVVVDGAAEVEVRGDRAILRNLAGQPPQWRRFECNGPCRRIQSPSALPELTAGAGSNWFKTRETVVLR
jgi:hypothetical protein